MYKNIGKKIKALARGTFIAETIAAEILGIYYVIESINWGFEEGWWGWLLIFFGPLVAWISSWGIYGFGELIDKASDIARNTHSNDVKSEVQIKTENERIRKIEKLRSQGLISEEEYKQAISKEK